MSGHHHWQWSCAEGRVRSLAHLHGLVQEALRLHGASAAVAMVTVCEMHYAEITFLSISLFPSLPLFLSPLSVIE